MNTHDIEPLKYGGNHSDDYVTGWNDCYAAIEHDRKGRGEPVAWMVPSILTFEDSVRTDCAKDVQEALEGTVVWSPEIIGDKPPVTDKHGNTYFPQPLVFAGTDFQPADPAAQQPLRGDEIQLANWLLRDPTNGERLVFASVPVNEGSFTHARMRSESGEDWTLTVRLKQGWLTAEQRAANFWSAANAEQDPS